MKNPVTFPAEFSKALQKSGMTKGAFAKAAGISGGFVSQLLSGERPPPLDRVEKWAVILGLSGQHASSFFSAALQRHVPDPVLLAARAQAQCLNLWLAEERGDTGPWPLDIHGKLPESPRAKELRELRDRIKQLDNGGLLTRLADLEAENAELRRRIATAAAALSTAAPTRVASERPRLSAEIDAIDTVNRHAATPHEPAYDNAPPPSPT